MRFTRMRLVRGEGRLPGAPVTLLVIALVLVAGCAKVDDRDTRVDTSAMVDILPPRVRDTTRPPVPDTTRIVPAGPATKGKGRP